MRIKNKYNIIICLTFFVISPVCVFAQSNKHLRDSLIAVLKNSKEDTTRLSLFKKLIQVVHCEDSIQKRTYLNQYLLLAQKIGRQNDVLDAQMCIADFYHYCVNNIDTALSLNKQCIAIAQKLGDKKTEALINTGIAEIYETKADHAKALKQYVRSMELNPSSIEIRGTLGNMGAIYQRISDYPNALDCFEKAYKMVVDDINIQKKGDRDDTLTLMGMLFNIADVHVSSSQYDQAINDYKQMQAYNTYIRDNLMEMYSLSGIGKCLYLKKDLTAATGYFKKALQKTNELKEADPGRYGEASDILHELGNIALETGKTTEAAAYAQQALALTEGRANNRQVTDLRYLPRIYILLGKIAAKEKNYTAAVAHMQRAIGLYKEADNLDEESHAWQALSITYEQMNKPREAFSAYKQYITLRDSVFSQEKAKEITRTEMQGEFDRKQMADSLLQVKKDIAVRGQMQRQRATTYASIAGLALVLLLSFFIYRNYTNQKKANIIISEEKENAEQQRQRAERSEQFKQQFLANMSHEIRTPMNAVSGMTDLLLDKHPRPDQLGYLRVISRSSDILLHIINDILDLSKIEAGKLELERIDFSLAAMLRQVRDTLSVKAEEKGLQLITSIDSSITDTLLGDPYRLNQVLINLGGNAIKFTDSGSVAISITNTGSDVRNVRLLFTVRDTGIGIPADKLPNLFGNYTQVNTSDTRKYGGTGLGLSISRQLVELLGGHITVESQVGQGTAFSFTIAFPLGDATKLAAHTQAIHQASGSVLNGMRILLADDNEYNRMVATEALRSKANIVIDEAANGEEVIKLMGRSSYDLVLMDVQMPVMSGLEAAAYIRTCMPAPQNNTPIIALTANMMRQDLDRCTHAGMNTYVPKPFKVSQLIAAIAEVTGRTIDSSAQEAQHISDIPLHQSGPGLTNLTKLRDFCEGNEEQMRKYVALYTKGIPSFREGILKAVDRASTHEIAMLIHSFKPKWLMMGMDTTYELALQLELSCTESTMPSHSDLQTLVWRTEMSIEDLSKSLLPEA